MRRYGYTHIRTVEHYFHPYGGYSPNPIVFLTAASQRTRTARMVTGAVLPVFNNPLKLAGEIGMLDAISGGRLEVGFARAFLPHEYQHFGVSLDESVARFDEGMAQVRRLLEEENVTEEGRFHSFENITSLPRPTQKPRPKFWTAALASPRSFEKAGRQGNWIMAIPIARSAMRELCAIYREAWDKAGHPGEGRVMLAFHMYCHEDAGEAVRIARDPLNRYLASLVDADSGWISGTSSADYKGYDKVIAALKRETFESQVENGAAWVGTPSQLVDRIGAYAEAVGGIGRRLAPGQFQRHEPQGCRTIGPPVRRRSNARFRRRHGGVNRPRVGAAHRRLGFAPHAATNGGRGNALHDHRHSRPFHPARVDPGHAPGRRAARVPHRRRTAPADSRYGWGKAVPRPLQPFLSDLPARLSAMRERGLEPAGAVAAHDHRDLSVGGRFTDRRYPGSSTRPTPRRRAGRQD